MKISSRVQALSESITLKLNSKAVALAKEGRTIYNLTAGQLPFRPHKDLVNGIIEESKFLSSFQYSPVAGVSETRETALKRFKSSRNIDQLPESSELSCIISNGAKHGLTNVLATILNPKDEVIVIAPYWLSYPQLIQLWGGKMVTVYAGRHNGFIPLVEEIEQKISKKTKAILINSPNNPTGVYYDKKWMSSFATMLEKYPEVVIISDEIYYDLNYFDPKPSYFYQVKPELLDRTIILDGISKNLACTGLRIGYTFATNDLIKSLVRLQGQTTSSANSLMQNALIHMDEPRIDEFLSPIKNHLRKNSETLRQKIFEFNLGDAYYQTNGAFYFVLDLSKTPYFTNLSQSNSDDVSVMICEKILEATGVAIIPLTDFGIKNAARLSLVLSERELIEALDLLFRFLTKK